MIRIRHRLMVYVFRMTDQLVLIALIIASDSQSNIFDWPGNLEIYKFLDLVLLLFGWIGIFGYFVKYNLKHLESVGDQLIMLLKANIGASTWMILIFYLYPSRSFPPLQWIIFLILSCALTCSSRVLTHHALIHARRIPSSLKFLLIIGPKSRTHSIANKIESKPELGYKIARIIEDSNYPIPDLRRIISDHRVDEILYCLSEESTLSEVTRIIREAHTVGIVVRILSSDNEHKLFSDANIQTFENHFVITLFQSHHVFQLLLKRTIDIIISLTFLILLSPILLVVAALIKLTSPGPILFIQVRVGLNQRKFHLFKFRSMVVDAEKLRGNLIHLNERNGPVFKITSDPRVTRFGRWLRRTSLDELPQLYNVLVGEMSLVGPRPPLPTEVESYDWIFRKRLSVKPGITCIWQVSGRDHIAFDRWMQMDHEYIENWSLWLDFKILLQTIPAVLLSRGAS